MREKNFERELKALANRRRLIIVSFIKDKKEVSVGEISDKIKLSFKATSRHLSVLSAADILDREQRSTQVYYKLSPNRSELVHRVINLL